MLSISREDFQKLEEAAKLDVNIGAHALLGTIFMKTPLSFLASNKQAQFISQWSPESWMYVR
jgi:riboflavin synthase alpha subunit